MSARSSLSYRYVPLRECVVPAVAECLTSREQLELDRLRDSHRRTTWLAGRYLLKQLVVEHLSTAGVGRIALTDLEISSRDGRGRQTRPTAAHYGRRLTLCLALTHSPVGVLAALAPNRTALGVDLAAAAQRLGPGFAELWFSPGERELIAGANGMSLHAAWAIKEAAYKALNSGEPFDPRQLCLVRTPSGDWSCRRADSLHLAQGCRIMLWQTLEQEVAVIATCQIENLTSPSGATS